MYTSKQCAYMTYHHSRAENHIGNGLIICNMGFPLKSWESGRVVGEKTVGVTDNELKYKGTHV